MAYAMLAWTHAFEAMNGWSDARESSLQRSQELATKAITLQEGIPIAHFVSGNYTFHLGQAYFISTN